MNKKIVLLEPFINSSYQFFQQWFAEAAMERGISSRRPLYLPWYVRLAAAKTKVCCTFDFLSQKRSAFLALCAGYPDAAVFPFCYAHEIVPVLWDTWPQYWPRLKNSLKRLRVRLAFFTQSQVADYIRNVCPGIICVHVPEGIKTDCYNVGEELINRKIDILELGRLDPVFHETVKKAIDIHHWTILFSENSEKLLFPDFPSLVEGLSQSKITICFPRCDTHPDQAGSIETLTQRYWECMLSRTIMFGRAPQELVNLIGYDPCIRCEAGKIENQLNKIMTNIGNYQSLVDKNYQFALKYASWSYRMEFVVQKLSENGYEI